jgi:hypothetical protein
MDLDYFTTTPEFKAIFHLNEYPGLSEFHLCAGPYTLENQLLIAVGGNFAKGPPSIRVEDIMVLITGLELPIFLRASNGGSDWAWLYAWIDVRGRKVKI